MSSRLQLPQKTINTIILYPIYLNVKDIDGDFSRIYDFRPSNSCNYDMADIFLSELAVFFKYMYDTGLNVYHIQTEPKHNIIFNNMDLSVFKNKKENIILTENWKEIKQQQSLDLFSLFNFNWFESSFIISHINQNNQYYYEMIVVYKNDFNINNLNNFNFNLIKINKINRLGIEDLTYYFFKKLLNFKELASYCFKNIDTDDSIFLKNDFETSNRYTNSKEYINYKNYVDNQWNLFKKAENDLREENDYLFYFYENLSNNIFFELRHQNYNIYLKNLFSQFGWSWFILDYNWFDSYSYKDIINSNAELTYPSNEICYIAGDYKTFNKDYLNLNFNEFVQKFKVEDYDFIGMLDNLICLGDPNMYSYNINQFDIHTKVLQFGTSYETYFNLNKNK